MKRGFVIFILLLSLLVMGTIIIIFIIGPISEKINISKKEQAKEFSLQIVKTYFDKDCNTFYNALSDTFYSLEDDGPHEKTGKFSSCYVLDDIRKPWEEQDEYCKTIDIKEKLCESLHEGVRGEYTFQDYLNSYNVKILEKTEYENEFPFIKNLQKFKPTSNDYLFVGYNIKANQDDFMWHDLLVFMVRMTEDGWRISALSG